MNTNHALLSASSSHRWLHCTPSAVLCANEPDIESEYAKEGTAAHEEAEIYLRYLNGELDKDEYEVLRKDAEERNKIYYNEEFSESVTAYVNRVLEASFEEAGKHKDKLSSMLIETRVDLSDYTFGGFGTVDCMLYFEKSKRLYIFDLKYGKGVKVDAYKNPQLMLYALGSLKATELLGDVESIVLNIVQPRLDNFSTYELSKKELLEFGNHVKVKAAKAIKGEGEFKPSPEVCRFCKIKSKCKARTEKIMSLYFEDGMHKDKALLSDEELGKFYEMGKELSALYEDLTSEMFKRMLNGQKIKGYKLAKGRKTRSFINVEKAIDRLCSYGFDKAIFYEKKPLALTKIEKIVGSDTFKEIDEEITQKEGSPIIVSEDSKKEEYLPLKEIFSE